MSSNKSIVLNTNRPGFFTPKSRATGQDRRLAAAQVNHRTFKEFKNTNISSTASFRYGDKHGMVSTQQIPIDYNAFENHTFFHSAVAKVNEAFDKIINYYPFDGNNKKIEDYEDTLTGFESHILKKFPKNIGYLVFSGTAPGETAGSGTHIAVKDSAGSEYLDLAVNKTGESILDPNLDPASFEFHINIPKQINDNQILIQKTTPATVASGITIALSQSNSTNTCNLIFGITSSSYNLYTEIELQKGKFNHIFAGYDRHGDKKLHLIKNIDLDSAVTSSKSADFGALKYQNSSMHIGSGSSVRLNGDSLFFIPKQTFSGSIDELRYYKSFRTHSHITEYKNKNLDFNTTDKDNALTLYFKFNEPYGNYSGNDIVLDSSGNSFNTKITNFTTNNRLTSSIDLPLKKENIERSPVLFPAFANVNSLNTKLMTTASLYDDYNPNIITKLIPSHYFEEGNTVEDFSTVFGGFDKTTLPGGSSPGTSQLRSAQQLTTFLLIWGKFFDELKIFVDAVSNLRNLSYDEYEAIPDELLSKIGEIEGMRLPALFKGANIDQLILGVDLEKDPVRAQKPLMQIQNTVWRRILASLPFLRKTKGTLQSVESVFRSAGLEPNNLFLIREYGGTYGRRIDKTTEVKRDIIKLLTFTGSNSQETQTLDSQGRPNKKPTLVSKYLSGARVEPGYPYIAGTKSDGLFTTSSFSFEGQYKFDFKDAHVITQSLARLHVTGTSKSSQYESAVVNLIYNSKAQDLTLFMIDSPSPSLSTPFKHNELKLSNINMFDSDLWNISFGIESGDSTKNVNSGSIFLRAAKASAGKIEKIYTTSSFYNRVLNSGSPTSVFSNISNLNTSGTFITIGSQSLGGGSFNTFINSNTLNPFYKSTNFTGQVGSIRLWSRKTREDEWKAHVRNPLNVGTTDPKKSYLFEKHLTGSFEKLRLQTYTKQNTTASDSSGKFRYFDFSHNNIHLHGAGFEPNRIVVKPEHVIFNQMSPYFDLSIADKKIRVRSLSDVSRQEENHYAQTTPVYEVFQGEKTVDDPRFSIEMSSAKGLNDDILRIFSDYAFLESALGKTNILFSDRYPDMIQIRKLYFENVLDKLDLGKYRDLFRWIDNSFTDLVGDLLPHTTKYMGINFVYENHVLERNRFKYLFDEIYLKSKPIVTDRSLLLSQFVAILKRM